MSHPNDSSCKALRGERLRACLVKVDPRMQSDFCQNHRAPTASPQTAFKTAVAMGSKVMSRDWRKVPSFSRPENISPLPKCVLSSLNFQTRTSPQDQEFSPAQQELCPRRPQLMFCLHVHLCTVQELGALKGQKLLNPLGLELQTVGQRHQQSLSVS